MGKGSTDSTTPGLVKKDTIGTANLKRDFLAEMGAFDQPSNLSEEEKSNLSARKDRAFEDTVASYHE